MPQGPHLQGSNITLQKILAPTDVSKRQTKIVCTLGPACWEVNQLEELIDAGMSVARFNFSHGDHDGHKACLDRLRTAAKNKNKPVGVLLDTKGPEIRSGFFADGADKISLTMGETLVLTADYSFKGDSKKLACSYPAIAKSVTVGQQILVADGSLVLTVLSIDEGAGEVSCRIENNASIGERKNMNLPGVVVDLPTLTDKDVGDIQEWGCKHGVDFIAASFVRKASDVTKIREVLGPDHQGIKIICKIENQEGLDNYDAILEATDGIMVARGDLGMEIPPEKVFLAQKMMIRKANIAGKPVITATQMLESMIQNPRPTRAEASDVANAVLDGTDCVMLSGETAGGQHPTAAVSIMSATCTEAEGALTFDSLYQAVRNSTISSVGHLGTSESIASSAVKTAIDVNASAVVVCSESGATAQQVAKFRPGRPITVLTTAPTVARQCYGVLKACNAKILPSLEHTESIVTETIKEFVKNGVCSTGDAVVVVHGTSSRKGATNVMRIQYA
uniref:Pyruvate kinase n=1 Tax=Grammatophora oceanica TaxID=210454 RepID=A0A7S1UWV7_9STRA|eukprot:CAMPEP_0194036508 /NCGR_PEP_ID=MMETSP0009_2-20130614/8864_1 /TAXON_ID=210454 /ORGANISM="Grammatophora oceanica, Strain CCMP 410" /LENGTH=505 /DNA_ID=CAMNT_0038678297 /DNA_START=41 /DNA_END=1558 /DNA_ORIENTATION=-